MPPGLFRPRARETSSSSTSARPMPSIWPVVSLRKAIRWAYTIDRSTGMTKPAEPQVIRQFDAVAEQIAQLVLHPLG